MQTGGLTAKQAAFVAEYLVDKNATQAAIRAGYSKHTANEQASRLLAKAHIRAAVDAELSKMSEKTGLSVELVFASLRRELSFDPAELYDEFGNFKPIHEMPEDARKCLVGMETAQVGSPEAPVMVQKVRWVNPAQAREQAMKHLGLFKADNDQNNPPPPPITEVRIVALMPKDDGHD